MKTVADKMTAAIFILVREQGPLVGSQSDFPSPPSPATKKENVHGAANKRLPLITFSSDGKCSL